MADYFTPTVVQPAISVTDMTRLEALLLSQIFEAEPHDDCVYFFAQIGPSDQIEVPIADLRAALAQAVPAASRSVDVVQKQLDGIADDAGYLVLDLSLTSWEFIFQDIVKRSTTLDHISIVQAFTCSRMRPDGFGGMVTLVTAETVLAKSTQDLLFEFLDQAEFGPLGAAPGHGVHVMGRLSEAAVRATVTRLIATDLTLATVSPDAVTDEDIRAGCLAVVTEAEAAAHGGVSADYRAAVAAIFEARRRLASG